MSITDLADRAGPGDGPYRIHFPDAAASACAQDEEWCEVGFPDGSERRIRFHDYHEIYPHPGLYEQLFYGRLACDSPATVIGLLGDELARAGVAPADCRAIDLGAGNGMVGDELARLGVGEIVGVDIIAQAAAAAARDRPGRYADYVVEDLCALSATSEAALRGRAPNLLTCVAALGFGDIPPLAFATAYDLLESDAWLAFNIRDAFLRAGGSPFAELIRGLRDDGAITILATRRYVHRLSSADGTPLHYDAIVARRTGPGSARERAAALVGG